MYRELLDLNKVITKNYPIQSILGIIFILIFNTRKIVQLNYIKCVFAKAYFKFHG